MDDLSPDATSAREANPFRRFLRMLGPGLVTGASDDDPSGIATYAAAGTTFGYAPLWLAWVTFPMMAAVQFIAAKIGMVTGRGIAGVLKEHYPRGLLYAVVMVLFLANTINAGADILAIAAGVNLIVPVPIGVLMIPIALLILALQIWGSYRLIARMFKWLTLSLFAYIAAAFFAHPDWSTVLEGTLRPKLVFNRSFLAMMVAVLGTTISPYLFFWQASQEVEEEIALGRTVVEQRRGATDPELRAAAWDVGIGMFFSNLVMFFIILANAATLHQAGQRELGTAAEAAEALRPFAGDAATILMAIGLIGTGLLAVPVLTGSAGYAVCETFGWPCSLDSRLGQAREFYAVLTLSTVAGLAINLIGISPMDVLFWTAVLNGLLAPPLLVVILMIANSRTIMAPRVNGLVANLLGGVTTLVMFAAAIGLIVSWIAP